MGLGPIFNLSAWDSVARQAMIRWATRHHKCPSHCASPLSQDGF